jgi:hypothetical protein
MIDTVEVWVRVPTCLPFSPKHLRNLTLTFWTQSGYVKVTLSLRMGPVRSFLTRTAHARRGSAPLVSVPFEHEHTTP